MIVLMIMERQVILKETHLEVMCRFQHLTFNYTAQKTMEGTEFYDVTFAVEDDKEISIVLELNQENSAAVVIDEVLEPTRDTLARDEVEGSNVAKAPTEKDVSQDTFKYEGRHFNDPPQVVQGVRVQVAKAVDVGQCLAVHIEDSKEVTSCTIY